MYVFCLFFHCGITFSSLKLFTLNRVPLEGAQIAVLLGIYKLLFLGFWTLVVALIFIFSSSYLLWLVCLFACLFSLCLFI